MSTDTIAADLRISATEPVTDEMDAEVFIRVFSIPDCRSFNDAVTVASPSKELFAIKTTGVFMALSPGFISTGNETLLYPIKLTCNTCPPVSDTFKRYTPRLSVTAPAIMLSFLFFRTTEAYSTGLAGSPSTTLPVIVFCAKEKFMPEIKTNTAIDDLKNIFFMNYYFDSF